jgi:hypothetical protein
VQDVTAGAQQRGVTMLVSRAPARKNCSDAAAKTVLLPGESSALFTRNDPYWLDSWPIWT